MSTPQRDNKEDGLLCDLCRLEVGKKPFVLVVKGGETKFFCCEACLGIYRLLNEEEADEN